MHPLSDVAVNKEAFENLSVIKLSEHINEFYVPNMYLQVVPTVHNPFLECFILAYNYHLNIKLRPDDIWLVIAQAIMHHLHNNKHYYRLKIHDKTFKQIDLQCSSLENMVYAMVQNKVSQTNSKFVDLLINSFSTSTGDTLLASEINVLSGNIGFQSYGGNFECGIPNLILDGTLEDWKEIHQRLLKMKEEHIELDTWVDEIIPISLEFINAYQGIINKEFWGKMISLEELWGSHPSKKITGWLTKFFPFTVYDEPQFEGVINTFPQGLTSLEFDVEKRKRLELVSGFMAIVKNPDTYSISPYIGWYLKEVRYSTRYSGEIQMFSKVDTIAHLQINEKTCCCIQ